MLRTAFAVLIGLLLVGQSANAQEWADKMFNTLSHDFGPVARGSKAQFRFEIKNIYEEDAHMVGVRSSCGCTIPQLTKTDLKTFETSEIVADFNTRDFLGNKSATLTVSFDKPFRAEVQLHVTGFIRSDIVLQPGALDWGTVDLGSTVEKRLQVTYAGRSDWEILDVKTADPHFEVEIKGPGRSGGKTSYELLVRLTNDAPVGYIKDQLILVTNDRSASELPVDMEGRVVPDITISPTKWFIGVVKPGQTVTRNLFVRGKTPFKIIEVNCPDKSFKIETSKESKSVHVIPVVFTAGDDPGKIVQKISIRTDHGEGVAQAFTAFAEVVKSEVPSTSEPGRADEDELAPSDP